MENLHVVIDNYPDEYIGIKKQAKKYIQNGSNINELGRLNILHRPWVAPLNWALMLYEGADLKSIKEAEEVIQKPIPEFYSRFLTHINGCFLYDISMFGLIHSLTRSFLQCHDLTTANCSWIAEYEIDQNFFHFGGGRYSYDENTGYFYGNNKIISILNDGKIINEWSNFTDFLNDELIRAEREMLKDVPKNTKLIVNE